MRHNDECFDIIRLKGTIYFFSVYLTSFTINNLPWFLKPITGIHQGIALFFFLFSFF